MVEGNRGPDVCEETSAVPRVHMCDGPRSGTDGRHRSDGIAAEEEGEGIPLGIRGQLVEHPLEVGLGIGATFAERVQHAHEDLAGLGARGGLGPEAHLAGDDRGAEFPLAPVMSAFSSLYVLALNHPGPVSSAWRRRRDL